MKSSDMAAGMVFLAMSIAGSLSAAESWTMENPSVWARDKDAIRFAAVAGGFEVRHSGVADWCVNGFPRIAATHGDVFELSCEVAALADSADSEAVGVGAVLYGADGKVVNWVYAPASAKPGGKVKSRFMVPRGVSAIRPRVLGSGRAAARVLNVRFSRTGNALPRSRPAPAPAFGFYRSIPRNRKRTIFRQTCNSCRRLI